MKHFAVIPVKEKSERIKDKNFRVFRARKSLLEIKIEQLITASVHDRIFISSDSARAKKIAHRYGAEFIERSPRFCNNRTPWSEVVTEVLSSLPISGDSAVSWCQVTSPLFSNFRGAARIFERLPADYNGLFTVGLLKKFILDSRFRPVNYRWGAGHKHSQDLPSYYFVNGALFMGRKSDLLKSRYFITSKPYALETSEIESVDIDTPLDFEFARSLYRR